MTEHAIVCEILDKKIKVTIESDCAESCGACGKKKGKNSLFAVNTRQFDLKPGDRVEIFASQGKIIFAAFLLFILPLILFIIFYFLGKLISHSTDELLPFISGVLGIGLGIIINLVIKLVKKQEDLPEITRVLS